MADRKSMRLLRDDQLVAIDSLMAGRGYRERVPFASISLGISPALLRRVMYANPSNRDVREVSEAVDRYSAAQSTGQDSPPLGPSSTVGKD